MALQVDPDKLRAFAGLVDGTVDTLSKATVEAAFEAAAGALPGTEVGGLVRQAAQRIAAAMGDVGGRLADISHTAHGSANSYQVAEDDFVRALERASQEGRQV